MFTVVLSANNPNVEQLPRHKLFYEDFVPAVHLFRKVPHFHTRECDLTLDIEHEESCLYLRGHNKD